MVIIIHKTNNFVDMDITFGKKLIDVFHPDALFLELPPITQQIKADELKNQTAEESISLEDIDLFMKAPSQPKSMNSSTSPRLMSKPINLIGGRYSKCISYLIHSNLQDYIKENMLKKEYVLRENENSIYFNSNTEAFQVPLDFPTYLYYFNKKYRSDRPILLCDFTEDEIACDFIQNTNEEKRHSIKSFIKCFTLLSMTSWIHHINNFGCTMCSKFYDKDNIKLWPTPIQNLINDNIRK